MTSQTTYTTNGPSGGNVQGVVLMALDSGGVPQPISAANPLPGSGGGGGGGGGAVTVADGANVAQGTTTDAAWTSGGGTLVSILKGIFGKWSLGHGTAAAAVRVELPTDGTGQVALASGTTVAVSACLTADGANATQGSKADARATDAVSNWSVVSLLKGIYTGLTQPFSVNQLAPTAAVAFQAKIATGGTAVQLASHAVVKGIKVVAAPTNVTKVFVGATGVTTTDDGTGNGFPLPPGASATFPCTNSNVWFINSATTADYVYVAED